MRDVATIIGSDQPRGSLRNMKPDAVTRRRGLWAWALTTGACAWSVAMIVAATTVQTGGETLVQQNGAWVLILVAFPAVISGMVWLLLHHRCSHGGEWTGRAASMLTGLLLIFTLVGMASIGMFVLPGVALLALGAHLTPSGPSRLQN